MTKHIILLIIYSFISTLLPLPISPIVIYFYANLTKYNIIITILTASLSDTITAILVYYIFLRFNYERFEYYTKPLKKTGIRGNYAYTYINTKLYDILSDDRTQKIVYRYGIVAIALASSTPLPFSTTLYAAGIVGYGKPLTLGITTFIGRIVNYTLMWLLGLGIISL